jgi:hypothetical protein
MNGGRDTSGGGDAGSALPHPGVMPAKAGIHPVAAPPPRWSGEASGWTPASAGVTREWGHRIGRKSPLRGEWRQPGGGCWLQLGVLGGEQPPPAPFRGHPPHKGEGEALPRRTPHPLRRHGRARPGHPTGRFTCCTPGWVPGSSPGMTRWQGSAFPKRRVIPAKVAPCPSPAVIPAKAGIRPEAAPPPAAARSGIRMDPGLRRGDAGVGAQNRPQIPPPG